MNLTSSAPPSQLRSYRIYGFLVLFCLLTALVGRLLPATGQPIRGFELANLVPVLLGFGGIYLGFRTGFPALLDDRIPNRRRLKVPLVVGLAFGLADVALFCWVLHPEPVTDLQPFMQPFPYSLLRYGAGALETEAIHRLIPIPLMMWAVGGGLLGNPRSEALFWVLAVLTSLVEPYVQLPAGSAGLMVYSFLNGFVFNLFQAVCFRREGFLASLVVRLGHYLIWHVGFGLVVEFS